MSEGQPSDGGPLGNCPACGAEVIEGKKGYGCSNWREQDGGCRFVVWKEIAGQRITPDTVRILLSMGTTPPMMFRSKGGKEFSASLRIELNEPEGKWETRFVSAEKAPPAKAGKAGSQEPGELGKCPRCGADVEEGLKGFGCRNWRKEDGGCRFVIWKVIAGKELPPSAVRDLLTKGKTEVIHGFTSKKGNKFSARLRLEGEDFKTVFLFDDKPAGSGRPDRA